MLSQTTRQNQLITMDVLASKALEAWVEAKTLAERYPGNHDVQVLADQIKEILGLARGVASVLRDEGEPT